MTRKYVVEAFWDDDVQVWVALSNHIPGLAVEAKTFAELREVIEDVGPYLVAANIPGAAPIAIHDLFLDIVPEPPLD